MIKLRIKKLYVKSKHDDKFYQVLAVVPVTGAPLIIEGDGDLTEDEFQRCVDYCEKYGFEYTWKVQLSTIYGKMVKA